MYLPSLRGQKIETLVEVDRSGHVTGKDGRTKSVKAALEVAFGKVTVSLEFERALGVAPFPDQVSPSEGDGY